MSIFFFLTGNAFWPWCLLKLVVRQTLETEVVPARGLNILLENKKKGHFGRKRLKILLSVANCRSLFFAKIYFLLIQFLLPTKYFALVPIEVCLELVVSPCGAVVEEALALGRGATRLPGAQGQQGVRGRCGGSEAVRPCEWEILFQRNC